LPIASNLWAIEIIGSMGEDEHELEHIFFIEVKFKSLDSLPVNYFLSIRKAFTGWRLYFYIEID
jgi:hypothetical protein